VSSVSNVRRWAIVALLFCASLINYLDRATLSVALPLISSELTLGPAKKGLLLSAFFWSYTLMQVPAGWLADRWNLRWIYAGLFSLWSLACGLTGLAGSLGVLIALRLVLGLGECIYFPGGSKIVSVLFGDKERGLAAGVFDSGTRVGMALGVPMIAWLTVSYGWRRMFYIVGFSALLWLVPWLIVFPSRLNGHSNHARKGLETRPGSRPGRPPFAMTFNRNLLGICLGFFSFGYYWYLLVTWLPDYLITVRHFTLLKAGLYASLPYLVFGASQALGGWIADRLIRLGWNETRARKGMVTVAFLSGLFLIPATRVASPAYAIGLLCAASLVGLSTGNILAILQRCAPPDEVGVWTGMENFVGNIAGVLAPLVTGFLISRTGSYSPAFVLAPLILVAGLLSYWFIVGDLIPRGGSRPRRPKPIVA